ncbi:MAG: hypothetical protein MJH09_06355 [Cetobacterium sp.]|nr:hypothetical protein [Cetobacterium sp.]
MKKLILGLMILGSISAFANGRGQVASKDRVGEKTATVQMIAYSTGGLQLDATNSMLDFGNLKAYNGEAKSTVIKVSEDSIPQGQQSNLTVVTEGNAELTNANGNDKLNVAISFDKDRVATNKNVILTTVNPLESVDIYGKIDKSTANNAPVGQYEGQFTVTAYYNL